MLIIDLFLLQVLIEMFVSDMTHRPSATSLCDWLKECQLSNTLNLSEILLKVFLRPEFFQFHFRPGYMCGVKVFHAEFILYNIRNHCLTAEAISASADALFFQVQSTVTAKAIKSV